MIYFLLLVVSESDTMGMFGDTLTSYFPDSILYVNENVKIVSFALS